MSQPTVSQLQVMMDLQDRMNSKVNPHWREQNFAWYRAIWIECAELLDHYGWKWWKHQHLDREQVVLELIDIWHFGLSILINRQASAEEVCAELTLGVNDLVQMEFPEQLEAFTEQVLHTRSFDTRRFGGLMRAMDLDCSQLYASYVGKNVLNMFRQDKGYKDGSYIKMWDGKDDNEWLVEFMNQLDSNTVEFADDLYQALEQSYPE